MAPVKPCLRFARNLSPQDALRCQKTLRPRYQPTRRYATSGPAKPRSYADPPRSQPLVGTRPSGSPPPPSPFSSPAATSRPPPGPKDPKGGGVAYPYLRISLGVVLCGSITYSMVSFSCATLNL